MAGDIERAVAADKRETTQEHWVPPGRVDLVRRLDQIADKHPSSTRYDAVDRRQQASGEDLTDRLDRPVADGRSRTGWDAPNVRTRPDRPNLDSLHLPDERARHIVDGDGPGTKGGGHRHGTGRPRKTEFTKDWSDDKIVSMVQDIARNPDVALWLESTSRWRVKGDRDGVRVNAIVLPDGKIWTSWPDPGGRGVIQNPR